MKIEFLISCGVGLPLSWVIQNMWAFFGANFVTMRDIIATWTIPTMVIFTAVSYISDVISRDN